MRCFAVTRRPPFLADDVILHRPCHILGVAVGSCAACCSPVCCRCSHHMDPLPSCVCLAALSRLSLAPLLHRGSRVVVFKRRIWFPVECITGMGRVNEIQWLAPLFRCFSIQVEDAKESEEEAHKSSPNIQDKVSLSGYFTLKMIIRDSENSFKRDKSLA